MCQQGKASGLGSDLARVPLFFDVLFPDGTVEQMDAVQLFASNAAVHLRGVVPWPAGLPDALNTECALLLQTTCQVFDREDNCYMTTRYFQTIMKRGETVCHKILFPSTSFSFRLSCCQCLFFTELSKYSSSCSNPLYVLAAVCGHCGDCVMPQPVLWKARSF